MKRAILMSIQPKWLVKILNGDKTIEIRKTMPKCDLPIDVYLYCTKGETMLCDFGDNEFPYKNGGYELSSDLISIKNHDAKILNGKVVAKFTLKHVSTCLNTDYGNEEILKNACLTKQELDDYVGKRKFFAWHIDNLVIFDKPMELSEFEKEEYYSTPNGWFPSFQSLTKAPQSWQYVWLK